MEEKLRILKMVEEGKLTAEQAVELLKALEGTVPEQETTDSAESFYEGTHAVPENIPYENKMLRIIVDKMCIRDSFRTHPVLYIFRKP